MPNRQLFRTEMKPLATAYNAAGGKAYQLSDMHALAQYACTGVFNNSFYIGATSQLQTVLKLCQRVKPIDIARIAAYARTAGHMKDMPAFLTAYLFSLEDKTAFTLAFPHCINNIGQLRNFVQIVRSGVTGRKSLGSAGKRAIANMLNNMPAQKIFWQAIGTKPSLADVIKLSHPRPVSEKHDALFGYLLGKDHNHNALPEVVKQFEAFKR